MPVDRHACPHRHIEIDGLCSDCDTTWHDRTQPREKSKATRAAQAIAVSDLWSALGLPAAELDPYFQRNEYATSWDELLAHVRTIAQGPASCAAHPWCVLRGPHIGPCYSAEDVGHTPGSALPAPTSHNTQKPAIYQQTSAVRGSADGA
jgi:hypothetical protein